MLVVLFETALLMKSHVGNIDVPTTSPNATCRNPAIRREWRQLERNEKDAYLDAVLCLFNKRSIFPDRGSAYDDIVFVHQYSGQAGKPRCHETYRAQEKDALS